MSTNIQLCRSLLCCQLKWLKNVFVYGNHTLDFLLSGRKKVFKLLKAHTRILTLSNLSLFRMCCATKRVPSIVFSTSRNIGLSNVGLMPSTTQHDGLKSPLPVGLNSSSSPPGNGNAGNGGSPKHGPTPPDAATSNLDGITKRAKSTKHQKYKFIELEIPLELCLTKNKMRNPFCLCDGGKKPQSLNMLLLEGVCVDTYLAAHSRWCCNRVWIYLRLEGNETHRLRLLVDRYHHRVVDCLF